MQCDVHVQNREARFGSDVGADFDCAFPLLEHTTLPLSFQALALTFVQRLVVHLHESTAHREDGSVRFKTLVNVPKIPSLSSRL